MANKYLGINGLIGFGIAVVLLVGLAVVFFAAAINIQKEQATNYYEIDSSKARMIDTNNASHYKLNKE